MMEGGQRVVYRFKAGAPNSIALARNTHRPSLREKQVLIFENYSFWVCEWLAL